jgi:hypothetical protein
MGIKSRYLAPKTTGIAGSSTGAGTEALVVPEPNTRKTMISGFLVLVLPKYQNR